MHVISANYRDRESPQRWLVRGKKDTLESARAVSSVFATGVQLVLSSDGEQGFGCKMVAEAESVVTDEASNAIRKSEIQLRFCGYWFETLNGEKVGTCKTLRLTSDGNMYAILPKKREGKREELKTVA